MFKDYYKILEIAQSASDTDIKKAYRGQAIKWHPDRNIGVDTTPRMQDINEAYLILKDKEARARYDVEYKKYIAFVSITINEENLNHSENTGDQNSQVEYKVEDDVLEKWIINAKRQAISLAQQTIRDFKGVSQAASQGCLEGIKRVATWLVVANVLYALVRGCR